MFYESYFFEKKIFVVSNNSILSNNIIEELKKNHELTPVDLANIIIVVGGDGTMLRAIRSYKNFKKPFFGINTGNVGFLLNNIDNISKLETHIKNSKIVKASTIFVQIYDQYGKNTTCFAINDTTLYRKTIQSASIEVWIDEILKQEVFADGIIVATPLGSTAYNSSAGGPIISLQHDKIVLTPICPIDKKFSSDVLPSSSNIKLIVKNFEKRPVNASVDFETIFDVVKLEISIDKSNDFFLLHNRSLY